MEKLLDLSGTLTSAGGVGGLLSIKHWNGGTNDFLFPFCDSMGNVVGVLDQGGPVGAVYEYGPFGEPLQTTGLMGKVNPFRWSTKMIDDEPGISYYGYRYYNPVMGRWPTRDPNSERGGINFYGMVRNGPVNRWDYLGLLGLDAPFSERLSPPGSPNIPNPFEHLRWGDEYKTQEEFFDGRWPGWYAHARLSATAHARTAAIRICDKCKCPAMPVTYGVRVGYVSQVEADHPGKGGGPTRAAFFYFIDLFIPDPEPLWPGSTDHGETQFGDLRQGHLERLSVLGNFQFRMDWVSVSCLGDGTVKLRGELRVIDRVGVDAGDQWKPLLGLVFWDSRMIVRAKWILEGYEICR